MKDNIELIQLIFIIIIGVYFLYSTYKEEKDLELDFTNRFYIIHLAGYFIGIILVLGGLYHIWNFITQK